MDTAVVLRRCHLDTVPGTLRALSSNRGPGFAGHQVHHAAGHRVGHRRPLDKREHHCIQGQTLLGVQAAVNRVDQHQRIVSSEAAASDLLGQHRETFAVVRRRLQPPQDDGLRSSVELHRPVAARAYLQLLPAGLRARQRQNRLAHVDAYPLEEREPLGRSQR